MATKPTVSIICITYNHERFISQTLDGFVKQKTDFDFELIIHDDASTDKTAEIIRRYEKANTNPHLKFRPIYETENQYSKGPYDFINDMLRSAKGDYLAFCEGDDYWTDPSKLQQQVNFLEKNADYSVCFHPVKVVFEDGSDKPYVFPDPKAKQTWTTEELLHVNFIQSNSVMYRRQDYKVMPNDIMPHDHFLHLFHAQFGKIGFIDKVMSVYRRHAGGVWWESHSNRDQFWKRYGLAHLKFYQLLLNMYGKTPAYYESLQQPITTAFHELAGLASKGDSAPLRQAIVEFPDLLTTAFVNEYQVLQDTHQIIETSGPRQIKELEGYLAIANKQGLEMQKERDDLRVELTKITNSSSYKVAQRLAQARHPRKAKP